MKNQDKTVLICTYGHILGHVGRSLRVAQELRAMGHRVLFAGQGRHLDLARQEGFEIRALADINPATLLKAARQFMPIVGLWTVQAIRQFVQAELALMREVEPRVVISDLRPTVSISARLVGVPRVSLTNAYMTQHTVFPLPMFSRWFYPVGEAVRRRFLRRPFVQVLRKHGLPLMKEWSEVWTGDLTLLLDIPEYAPLTHQPRGVHYVGPVLWEPDIPLPEWIDDLESDKPTIYFTMGSTGHAWFFQELAESFHTSAYQFIVTTGGQAAPGDLAGLSSNFHAADFLPGLEVMSRSDLVVCHGGNGTVYQALSSGVPVIAIPTHPEQEWNADRLTALDLGLKLKDVQAVPLKRAIDEILNTPRCRSNAMRFKELLANHHGARTAAYLVDELLE